ncbi:MAG: hypothetical protein ABI561_09925 [Bradyrhizobium sp.]
MLSPVHAGPHRGAAVRVGMALVAAFFAGLSFSTTAANAACAPDPATSGQTVTCRGNDADGFQAGAGVNALNINVLSGATVNDNGAVAIGLNDSSVVTNSGTLTAGVGLTGLRFGDFNTVTNNATIMVGDGGIGIAGLNSNTVTNSGTVTATANGIAISIQDNSTITTSGTLAVGSFGTCIFAGQNEKITNTATGIINVVDNGKGIYVAGNSTVTNAGAITTGLFQTLPGAAFAVGGAAQAHDSALLTGAAEMKWLNGFSLAGVFEGQFSDVTSSYAGKGTACYSW